jgi:hypothetical protein
MRQVTKSAWKPTHRRRRRRLAFVFVVSMAIQSDATPQLGVTGRKCQGWTLTRPRWPCFRHHASSDESGVRGSRATASGNIFTRYFLSLRGMLST